MFKRTLTGIAALPLIGVGIATFPAGIPLLAGGAFFLYKACVAASPATNTSAFTDSSGPAGIPHNDDCVNPATGLPMIGGIGGLDCSGNGYGVWDDD